jgi:predicted nuclease with TOPRIM domain
LEDQNSYLNDTLQKKSQELLKEKTTLANDLISLRSKLSEATEEIRQLEVAKSNLNAQLITFKTKADQNYNEIRELTVSNLTVSNVVGIKWKTRNSIVDGARCSEKNE